MGSLEMHKGWTELVTYELGREIEGNKGNQRHEDGNRGDFSNRGFALGNDILELWLGECLGDTWPLKGHGAKKKVAWMSVLIRFEQCC